MTRVPIKWKLPKPENGKKTEWKPVVRVGYHIPFGYEQDEADPDILLPISKELELLEDAKKYLKRYSLRQVANWLSEESGRYISHVGLQKRIKLEQRRSAQITNLRYYEEKAKEAAAKAEKLARRIGGTDSRIDTDGSSDAASG